MGVRAPLAMKSLVSMPRVAIKSLILEAKVCFVSHGEHRKSKPVAAGRRHGRSRCLRTLPGRRTPWGGGPCRVSRYSQSFQER